MFYGRGHFKTRLANELFWRPSLIKSMHEIDNNTYQRRLLLFSKIKSETDKATKFILNKDKWNVLLIIL